MMSVGFLLKKILGLFFMPLSVCLLFFAAGGFYALTRRSREAVAPFAIGSLLLYAFSLHSVAGYLISPLEQSYPPLNLSAVLQTQKNVKWIVVLGSGHGTVPGRSACATLDEAALSRLAEGMRLANALPDAVLVLSGCQFRDEQNHAQVMAAAAVELGMDPARLVLSDQSMDTADEAEHIKNLVAEDSFVLVTSASHMLRAVKLFEHQGLAPLPAPAYYRDKHKSEMFLPHPENISTCHLAVHEYLGLAWAFLRGQISLTAP